jgi:hypothetical protein
MTNITSLDNFSNSRISLVKTDLITDSVFYFLADFFNESTKLEHVYQSALETYEFLMTKGHIPTIKPSQNLESHLKNKFFCETENNTQREIKLMGPQYDTLQNILHIYNQTWLNETPELKTKYNIQTPLTKNQAFQNAITYQTNEFLKYLNDEPSMLKLPPKIILLNDKKIPNSIKQSVVSKNKLSFGPAYIVGEKMTADVVLDITEKDLIYDLEQ